MRSAIYNNEELEKIMTNKIKRVGQNSEATSWV